MSTWEELMSARAQQRMAAERARLAAAEAEERRLAAIAEAFGCRAMVLAGPPDGCAACWWYQPRWPRGWWHGEAAEPGPPPAGEAHWQDADPSHWCWHGCHDDPPVYCGPVVMAAAG